MIHTDGKPTIANSRPAKADPFDAMNEIQAAADRKRREPDGLSVCFNDRLRRMTDGIGRGAYAGPERRQSGCPACVAEGRPAMQAGGCYRHDN